MRRSGIARVRKLESSMMRPQEEACWARTMYKKPPESEHKGINTSLLPWPLSLALQPFIGGSYWPTLPEGHLTKEPGK